MRGFILSGLLVMMAGMASAEVGRITVTPLVEDVWMHTTWRTVEPWGRVPSNGLVVREAEQVVVVDTAWGAAGSRELLAWIERELRLPVSHLIVTHFHADRLEGWEVFAAAGARVVASKDTLRLAGIEATAAFAVFTPDSGDGVTGRGWEVRYPGPAHSPDNLVVWFPQRRVLAGGCAVRALASHGLGNTGDASIEEWADSIRRVLQSYPDAQHVVPGHGQPGGVDLLEHTIELAEAAKEAAGNR